MHDAVCKRLNYCAIECGRLECLMYFTLIDCILSSVFKKNNWVWLTLHLIKYKQKDQMDASPLKFHSYCIYKVSFATHSLLTYVRKFY